MISEKKEISLFKKKIVIISLAIVVIYYLISPYQSCRFLMNQEYWYTNTKLSFFKSYVTDSYPNKYCIENTSW